MISLHIRTQQVHIFGPNWQVLSALTPCKLALPIPRCSNTGKPRHSTSYCTRACLAATVSTSPTSAALLLGGNLLFSGSLYALVLTGKKKLGAITPIGGLMYILGWLALAFSF
jgi:hypothetical protein